MVFQHTIDDSDNFIGDCYEGALSCIFSWRMILLSLMVLLEMGLMSYESFGVVVEVVSEEGTADVRDLGSFLNAESTFKEDEVNAD